MTFAHLIVTIRFPAVLSLSLFGVLFVGHAHAESSVKRDVQLWTPVSITFPIHNRITGYFEVSPRAGDKATNMTQLVLHPALRYQLTQNVSLGQGYMRVMNDHPLFRDEHRLYQQLLYTKAFPTWQVRGRARLEERFLDETAGPSLRARTLLRGTLPLGEAHRWSLVLSEELFVNLHARQNGPAAGLNQNRFFAGVTQHIQENLNITIGYQLQLINTRASRLVDIMNHILLFQTHFTFGDTPPTPPDDVDPAVEE